MIHAYIIDDERLARLELRQTLAEFAHCITVIGEAANKQEAVQYLANPQHLRPDVIFLDINMPNGSGFDVLEEIDYNDKHPIRVVFVTAYDEYAVRAFTVNALDYILKPIDPDRLEQTIVRLERALASAATVKRSEQEPTAIAMTIHATGNAIQEETDIQREAPPKLTMDDVIFVIIGKNRRFVPLSELVCITASDNYSEVRLADGKRSMLLRTMNEWEEILPENVFMRIHRGTIINIAYLDPMRPIEPHGSGALIYLQEIEEPLTVSRRAYAKWKDVV